jgi:transposase-like protein
MIKLSELNTLFPTEEACKKFLFEHRFPDGVVRCPRCQNDKPYKLSRAWHWQCHKCAKKGYRFSLITGTVFENTKYPLKTWFTVAFMMLHSKKGMSALQIKRMVFHDKASYETVWYMVTRIRAAMNNDGFQQLMGIVEVDEAYFGGKNKNRHRAKKQSGGGPKHKIPVIAAISRKGNVVCQVIENTSADTLGGFVGKVVSDKVDLVATDSAGAYREGLPYYIRNHQMVDHKAGEYVRGEVHTNNIESFWSLLKRGVMGSYHNVRKKYLPLYLAEFTFRHNNRKNPDIFGRLIAGC